MENIRSNAPDILHLEKKFRETIFQLQQITEAFESLQQEHLQIRQELCSKESLLENERRASNELRSRLKAAMETINRLEEEKMRERIDRSNLMMNYESMLKERAFLTQEATSGREEAAKFKLEIETLKNSLHSVTQRGKKFEESLIELKKDNERITATIDMYIAKLTKEQKYLLENCKMTIMLNRRLQTFGLCFHAIEQKNKAEIKDLQRKLIATSINDLESLQTDEKLHPEIENLCFKLREMLTELKTKVRNSVDIEVCLNKILEEFPSRENINI